MDTTSTATAPAAPLTFETRRVVLPTWGTSSLEELTAALAAHGAGLTETQARLEISESCMGSELVLTVTGWRPMTTDEAAAFTATFADVA